MSNYYGLDREWEVQWRKGRKLYYRGKLRWSRNDEQKKDVYFFCYGNQNQRGVARQTA